MTTQPSAPSSLNVLRVDASARLEDSLTRSLADRMIAGLRRHAPALTVTRRDVAQGLPFVDADWVHANFTDPDARSAAQRHTLAGSDALVAEAVHADVWIIGAPIYNFGVPASLKAWIDQIARARLTFRYTEHGPQGLLDGKKVYILTASGGTAVGGDIDFGTPWLKFVLGFLGINDIEIVAADRVMARGDDARQSATDRIDALLARDWPALAAA